MTRTEGRVKVEVNITLDVRGKNLDKGQREAIRDTIIKMCDDYEVAITEQVLDEGECNLHSPLYAVLSNDDEEEDFISNEAGVS